MADPTLIPLPGSYRTTVTGARQVGPAAPDAEVRLTVQLRPRDPAGLAAKIETPGYRPYSREEFDRAHAPADEDIAAVRGYLESRGLSVVAVSPDRRSLSATGPVAAAEGAFDTTLHTYERDGRRFHARAGQLRVPEEVASLVEGVFGLDRRPFARPHTAFPTGEARIPGLTPLTALDVARAYGFPAGDGVGQTIGIVELGGGYQESDLRQYFAGLDLPEPRVIAVGVGGGSNNPTVDRGADGEVELDIQVAGAIAPAARIVVYFGKDASEGSFVDAINAVVSDTANAPSVVSISWGGPESGATAAARGAMDSSFQTGASLGLTFLCAAGDNGSADTPNAATATVDYPASSPYVTGCGGTALAVANGAAAREIVWNEGTGGGATGGGISAAYPAPPWQQNATLPAPVGGEPARGRGVPDVAGNADPYSGYLVRVDGKTQPIGGTSAVAPLWAGLIARINGTSAKRAGFLNPTIYAARGQGFRDITVGDNGIPPATGYSAGPGWDACTGWGSPLGAQLATVLGGQGTAQPQNDGDMGVQGA